MTCATHQGTEAVAYCRICGKPMCAECKRDVQGTIYCEPCLNRELHHAAAPPPSPQLVTHPGPIPGLAFGLGFIPGVGAIYNGQYAKGFVHIVIFGVIISILDSGQAGGYEPLLSILLAGFILYMPFEAYHTAKKRLCGLPVDEFSGVLGGTSGSPVTGAAGAPASHTPRIGGAAFLIGLGILLLLSNLGYLSIHQVLRYWPLILIVLGLSMLVNRMGGGPAEGSGGQ